MITIDPNEIPVGQLHGYLLGAVAPRPIAFASTMNNEGVANLAPFSFFNVFSANPPIMIFSPARSVRGNKTKNTLDNALETKEVVINVVNYDIVQQMSLASTAYPSEVDEFVKSGLTPVASDTVKPFRVKESPVQFECKVNEVIALGTEGGAGNLIVCEVTKLHIDEAILDENGVIDPMKIDLVARMGGNFYCRANESSAFEIDKPITKMGIGVDQIPDQIRNSIVLSGNNLGQLGNVEYLPTEDEINAMKDSFSMKDIFVRFQNDEESLNNHLHEYAKELLDSGQDKAFEAWKVLLMK